MWVNFVSLLHQHRDKLQHFQNLLIQLMNTLLKMGSYPQNFQGWEDSDLEKEDFEEYREKIRLVMTRLSSLLQQDYFLYLYKILSDKQEWNIYESVVHAIGAGNSEISKLENNMMPNLISTLMKLPPHPVLSSSIAFCFSNFGRWFRNHSQLIPTAINYIIHLIDSNHSNIPRKLVAFSLRDFCKSARENLAPSFPNIFNSLKNYLQIVGEDKDNNEAAKALLESAIFILPFLDVNMMKETLHFSLGHIFSFLEKVNLNNFFNCQRKTKALLEMISSCFYFYHNKKLSDLKGAQNPFYLSFEFAFPKFASFLEKTNYDKTVCSVFCDFISHAVQSGEELFSPFLMQMSQVLFKIYQQTHHCDSLYTFAELLSLFPDQIPQLFQIFQFFSQITFQIIQKDLQSNYEIVRAYFDAIVQPLFHFPKEFLSSELLKNTFIILVPSLSSQDIECVESIYRFSIQFWSERKEDFWVGVRENIFSQFGDSLFSSFFNSILNTNNRRTICYYGEIIFLILSSKYYFFTFYLFFIFLLFLSFIHS